MSINIKIKEKPDLKKMEISELISYMENDFNFKTSYSYEELKETADYLHELAVQGNTDAQYAYATLYKNVYYMPWDKLGKNKWYQKAIHAYEAMNTSDPEILLRLASAFLNDILGEDAETGMKICENMLNISDGDDRIMLDTINNTQFKVALEMKKYFENVADYLYDEENIREIVERRDRCYDEYDTYLYDEEDEEKAEEAYEAYEAADREYDESKYCYFLYLASGAAGQLGPMSIK